jgi:pimeloyl-ACP methyl ester carboxylesterase
MNKVLLLALVLSTVAAHAEPLAPPALAIPYGHNDAAGAFAEVNGIRLHYESYGSGEPVLLIHGNGGDIGAMGYQIEFFAPHYRVIATDSRNHGLSSKASGRITYEQMAEDINALLDRLQLKSVRVLGWSDGGIIGLLLAIHHPDKVGRLAIMGANLFPEGAHQWALDAVAAREQYADEMIAQGDKSQPWELNKQLLDLLGRQPHIPTADLEKIAIPVLVMAGDRDVIRPEHTQLIVDHLPHAQLAIFPGSTHMAPWRDHRLFNETVARFFAEPFARPETRADFGM